MFKLYFDMLFLNQKVVEDERKDDFLYYNQCVKDYY